MNESLVRLSPLRAFAAALELAGAALALVAQAATPAEMLSGYTGPSRQTR